MKFSQLVGYSNELEALGILDVDLASDSPYFVNILRLKETQIPEFRESYEKINRRFRSIGQNLLLSESDDDTFYHQAFEDFNFHEFNEICLGYSKGHHGKGFGEELRIESVKAAKRIIKSGQTNPEIFHLMQLFVKGIGLDRLSDMIGTIIREDFKDYTNRINRELGIISDNAELIEKGIKFNGPFIKNKFKKDKDFYFVPKEIISSLPTADVYMYPDKFLHMQKSHYDHLDNHEYRNLFSRIIGDEWKDLSIVQKKVKYEEVFATPILSNEIISRYKEMDVDEYNFENDIVGALFASSISTLITQRYPFENIDQLSKLTEVVEGVINRVENALSEDEISNQLSLNDKPRNCAFYRRMFYEITSSYLLRSQIKVVPDFRESTITLSTNDSDKIIVKISVSKRGMVASYRKVAEENIEKLSKVVRFFLVFNTSTDDSKIVELRTLEAALARDNELLPEIIIIDVHI